MNPISRLFHNEIEKSMKYNKESASVLGGLGFGVNEIFDSGIGNGIFTGILAAIVGYVVLTVAEKLPTKGKAKKA